MSEKKPLWCKNGTVGSLQKTEAGYKFETLYLCKHYGQNYSGVEFQGYHGPDWACSICPFLRTKIRKSLMQIFIPYFKH